jgi:hypothetical protein
VLYKLINCFIQQDIFKGPHEEQLWDVADVTHWQQRGEKTQEEERREKREERRGQLKRHLNLDISG